MLWFLAEVCLLGVLLDELLTLVGRVSNVTRACFHQLQKIKEMRQYIPTLTVIPLTHALIIARVDYCISILHGLPATQLY